MCVEIEPGWPQVIDIDCLFNFSDYFLRLFILIRLQIDDDWSFGIDWSILRLMFSFCCVTELYSRT